MSFALASSRATARVAAVSASTTTSVVRVPRRFASAAFAHMKVKKNNWVEQNEILRENQFNNWGMHSGNLFGLLMMVVVLPLGYRKLYMQELAGKEIAEGVPVRDRF